MIVPSKKPAGDDLALMSGRDGRDVSNGREESRRRTIVNAIYLLYLIWIFEGVLRKWLLPSYSQILYFVRDPVVLWLYAYALIYGRWQKSSALLAFSLILAVLVLLLAGIQLILGFGIDTPVSPAIFAAYGWRNYFLYIPLAFLAGTQLNRRDLNRFSATTIVCGIGIAALVFVQFHAPINSPLNVGSADDITQQFIGLGLDETHTRPMGTFTSVVGQGGFVSLLAAFTVIELTSSDPDRKYRLTLGMLGVVSLAVSLAYSGSRGTILSVLFEVLAAGLILQITGRSKEKSRFLKIAAGVAATFVVFAPIALASGIATLVERWRSAYETESVVFSGGIFGRALYGFVDFARLVFDAPILGYGLGSAGNASTLLGSTLHGLTPLAIAETDWSRHIFELGPIIGVLYIAFRVAFFIWLLRVVIRSPSISSAILFGTVSLMLLYGQIATHGSANIFGWLTVGFTLAAARRGVEGSPTAPMLPRARFLNVIRR